VVRLPTLAGRADRKSHIIGVATFGGPIDGDFNVAILVQWAKLQETLADLTQRMFFGTTATPSNTSGPLGVCLSEMAVKPLKMNQSDSGFRPSDEDSDLDESGLPAISDARLVDEARRGNSEAFGQLVLRYERRVIRVIRRFMPDDQMAQDLTQEAFLRAFDRLEQFDPSRRFGPWLFRIAVNLTYDHLRQVKRRGKWALFSEIGQERTPDPATADPRARLDLSQEVQVVMADVPEAYRTVLILRDLEGFSTSEVAAVTERSEATIRWRLAEARRMFREVWERRERSYEESQADETPDSER
jgi:RNA polymerase sigma-70 factor (ECF subfamily)